MPRSAGWLLAAIVLGGCLGGGSGGSDRAAAASDVGSTSPLPAGATAPPAPVPALPPPASSPADVAPGGVPPLATPAPVPAGWSVIQVGPTRATRSIAAAARAAGTNTVIEIDPGDYRGDVAVFAQANLVIRGVGGRPRLDAFGSSAEGKAIFVVRGEDVTIENLEFVNAKVPDQNGAGIRHERGRLVIRGSVFADNENGILTGNVNTAVLEISSSAFTGNGFGDGFSHNLYVGQIARLVVEGSYFARARVGHLIKSRARENRIAYNRITNEPAGTASYEIDLSNGGNAVLLGNFIEQSAGSANSTVVAFGPEGYAWPVNRLVMAHNTVLNNRPGNCTFVFARAGATVRLVNNVFVGTCGQGIAGTLEQTGNRTLAATDLVDAAGFDFRPRAAAAAVGSAADPGSHDGGSLVPVAEYVHVARLRSSPFRGIAGAHQSAGP